VFIGDGSYLFVPDNPAYEGSVVLWFDEHNHPVNYEELSPAQRKKAHRERCYKLVSLLHLRGGNYVYAALAVVPGNRHELPVLYQLVEAFVRHVGPGVMKKLILDRGFIDGGRIAYCKTVLGVEVLLPLKKNMDLWQDAWALAQRLPWQEWIVPGPPPPPPVKRPEVIERRERQRQQTLAQKKAQEPLAGLHPDQIQRRLNFQHHFIVIYLAHAYLQLPLVSFTREVLELEPAARDRALKTIRRLEQSFLCPVENLRPP